MRNWLFAFIAANYAVCISAQDIHIQFNKAGYLNSLKQAKPLIEELMKEEAAGLKYFDDVVEVIFNVGDEPLVVGIRVGDLYLSTLQLNNTSDSTTYILLPEMKENHRIVKATPTAATVPTATTNKSSSSSDKSSSSSSSSDNSSSSSSSSDKSSSSSSSDEDWGDDDNGGWNSGDDEFFQEGSVTAAGLFNGLSLDSLGKQTSASKPTQAASKSTQAASKSTQAASKSTQAASKPTQAPPKPTHRIAGGGKYSDFADHTVGNLESLLDAARGNGDINREPRYSAMRGLNLNLIIIVAEALRLKTVAEIIDNKVFNRENNTFNLSSDRNFDVYNRLVTQDKKDTLRVALLEHYTIHDKKATPEQIESHRQLDRVYDIVVLWKALTAYKWDLEFKRESGQGNPEEIQEKINGIDTILGLPNKLYWNDWKPE